MLSEIRAIATSFLRVIYALKAEITGRNDMAIARIDESITKAKDQMKAIAQQAEAEKEAPEERLDKADRARETLMQNLTVMQQNLAAAVEFRKTGTMFTDRDMAQIKAVETPRTNTLEFRPALSVVYEPPRTNRPALNAAKIGGTHAAIENGKKADNEEEKFCKFYAEALQAKKEEKASRGHKNTSNPRNRAPQDEADDLVDICVNDM